MKRASYPIVVVLITAAWLIIVWLLNACKAPEPQLPVTPPVMTPGLCAKPEMVIVSAFFEDEYDAMLDVAITFWNQAAGTDLLFYGGRGWLLDDGTRIGFLGVHVATQERLATWEKKDAGRAKPWYVLGSRQNVCIMGTSVWLRDDGSYNDQIKLYTLIHELGHGLGLHTGPRGYFSHSNEKNTLMHGAITKDTEFRLGKDTRQLLGVLYGG
jgi:hypothetical protein